MPLAPNYFLEIGLYFTLKTKIIAFVKGVGGP